MLFAVRRTQETDLLSFLVSSPDTHNSLVGTPRGSWERMAYCVTESAQALCGPQTQAEGRAESQGG